MRILLVDIETTGLNARKDVIWQLALIQGYFYPDTRYFYVNLIYEWLGDCLTGSGFIEKVFARSDYYISHNANFEKRFLSPIFKTIDDKKWNCTMLSAADIINATDKKKFLKLEELVKISEMNNKPICDKIDDFMRSFVFLGYHDALYDVFQLLKCFCFLLKIQHIKFSINFSKTNSLALKQIYASKYGLKGLSQINIINEKNTGYVKLV